MCGLRIISRFLGVGIVALTLYGCEPLDSSKVDSSVSVITNANWLAYQDGPDSPWKVLERDNDTNDANSYSFPVYDPKARVGLALACNAGTASLKHRVEVFFGTASETWQVQSACDNLDEAPPKVNVSGTVMGVDVNAREAAVITFSENESFVEQLAYAKQITKGVHDILAYKGPTTVNALNETVVTPTRYFIAREVSIITTEAGSPIKDIDFNSVASFDAPAAPLTLNIGGSVDVGETREASVGFVSSNRNYLLLGTAGGGATISYYALPMYRASDTANAFPLQQRDEGHQAVVRIRDSAGQTLRAGYHFFKVPKGDDTPLTPPDPAAAGSVNASIAGSQIEAVWGPVEDATFGSAKLYHWHLDAATTDTEAAGTVWNVFVTPAWLGDAPAGGFVVNIPDFSIEGGAGWRSTWNYRVDSPIDYTFRTYLAKKSGALDILDFLLYSDVVDGLFFGELITRGQVY